MQLSGSDLDRECRALLGLSIKLGESLKGRTPEDLRLCDSESLAQKIVLHTCSIIYLSRNTRLEDVALLDQPVNFVDHASMHVLARALLETTWAFHHVFVEPSTEDERSFRYCCWKLAGFVQRQSFPTMTESAAAQLERDKTAIAQWREELESTQAFQSLTDKAKRRASNGERWRPSLRAMVETLLGKTFGSSIASFLSSYQHSDALSALQIHAAKTNELQRQAATSSLLLVAISLSNLIEGYLRLWPGLELVANRYPETQELVEMYSSFPTFEGIEQASRQE